MGVVINYKNESFEPGTAVYDIERVSPANYEICLGKPIPRILKKFLGLCAQPSLQDI